jgi:hypothetical protein
VYDRRVPERPLAADDLTALLERLRIQPAGTKTPSEVTQAQLDLLLARIGSLTSALRDGASPETERLAARLLLSDLALATAQFRAGANAVSVSLSSALDGLHAVLDAAEKIAPTSSD